MAKPSFGNIVTAGADLLSGFAADKASRFEAAQLRQQANAAYAAGVRQAAETRRKGEVNVSDAIAAIAASGGSTTDAGAVELLAKIKDVSDYNALAALYDAETYASGLRNKATIARFEGKTAKRLGYVKALADLAGGS